MKIFDGHNDTLLRLYQSEPDKELAFFRHNENGHIDLPRAKRGQMAGGLFAIFAPPPPESPERDPLYGLTFTHNGYAVTERSPVPQDDAVLLTDEVIELAYRLEQQSDEQVKIVGSYAELELCFEQETFALVLHIEGAEAIQADLSNLETYYHKGVRSIGLVWSRPNAFGQGVPFIFPHSPDTGEGLTQAGKELVRACNQLGIMIDLAHINAKGFRHVAELTDAPLVVTHADVYAICPSTRNLTDEQIDAVGQTGGVIGINFETLNTHPQSSIEQNVPLSQITAHIDYIANRIGIDHVALGSDFDGADMPDGIKDAAGLPNLIRALRDGGYGEEELQKIAYRNWFRVLKATWKT